MLSPKCGLSTSFFRRLFHGVHDLVEAGEVREICFDLVLNGG
jgi:hypothetical protein